MISIEAKHDRTFILRLIERGDAEALGAFFQGLSPATTCRFGPHPLTQQQAKHLCEAISTDSAERWVIMDKDLVAGYFIVERHISSEEAERYSRQGVSLQAELDVIFAPCIADAYQNAGLASAAIKPLMRHVKQQGARSLVLMGGTQESNHRARHFYKACGFDEYGGFHTEIYNIDMRAIL
ncbi:N-acetyltransferase family protein [Agarivorans sp. DSG3-1]|uniref:GNAT family N-acetyltransferase n=1 Tax=Agarivorans sp. DSG3-1 TaxID=3342249 RepID=UPI00398ECBFF